MTDTTTGSAAALLAGNPAGAPDPAAAATTATTANTTAADPAATAAADPAQAATGASDPSPEWFGKLPENIRSIAETKGWKGDNPTDAFVKVVDGYANLEKLLGSSERIALPTDPNDQAGWDKVWNRLGRPEKPDGYGFDKLDGADPGYAKFMSEALHKAGAPASMAKAMAEAHQQFVAQQMESVKADADAKGEAEINALKSEMGATYDEKIEAARRVITRDGISPEDLTALESVWGTGKTLRYFMGRGAEVMEDKGVIDTLRPSLSMTPDAADAEISRKIADPEFLRRYMSEDTKIRAVAQAEMERLQKLKAGIKA